MGRNDASGGAVSRAGSRDASLFFFGSFIVILIACLCGVYVVHAYWGRQARRLREERRLHEELNNPWAIRERYAAGTGVRSNEGSAKEGSVFGGSIVRGIMYGLYVLNPSGSFSFGSSRVETNEKEVKARREANRANAQNATATATSGVAGTATTGSNRSESYNSSSVVVAAATEDSATEDGDPAPPLVVTVVPDPWAPETSAATSAPATATRRAPPVTSVGADSAAGGADRTYGYPVSSDDSRVARHSVVAAEALSLSDARRARVA